MTIDIATSARRMVLTFGASLVACLCLVAVESLLGIGLGWRLLLNQVPSGYVVYRVWRWSEVP